MLEKALSGSGKYWAWVALLLAIIVVGFIFYLQQWFLGLGITGLSRDVSWGLYIANFTFLVGVAASAVMVVLPYYLHSYKEFRRMTTLGEFLAVAAILMCGLFIIVDLGQPTRALNIMLYPTLNSIFFWDMVVLAGYFFLNLVIGWYVLEAEHKGETPRAWIKPLILLSIPWAISIHTVTAFIYSGLVARPMWLTAIMAPRFLASAFASGPSFLIIASLILKKFTNFDAGREALQKLAQIVVYATIATLFFFLVESFTVFYSADPEHMTHFLYLLTGIEGKTMLVPWMWATFIFWLVALALLLNPRTRQKESTLALAAGLVFVSMWIDKGLGLLMPGFIPSPTGGLFEYWPTLPEALITLGVWGIGILALTVLYKIAVSVREEIGEAEHAPAAGSGRSHHS